ncbi:NAD(P)/FAD-dependent oxidoreductase [Maricurvus nonylphenolicus]|uniref:NAD(P)/FAD-dependent oxidoreductase n=1 Tax=Maricurvus nonylphenolicus TaxID=1008307 RepID=UPI0036F1BE7A
MSQLPTHSDVIIIGAGAAGLMCAITAGRRGRKVLVLDHANKVGKKILMSGGGRCNFTNMYAEPGNYLSANPHFCKSALSRYTQWDFIGMVAEHGVPYHEKTLGQLFCDNKSQDILDMLLRECDKSEADIRTHCEILAIKTKEDGGFTVSSNQGEVACNSLVIATGGLSIPTMGATGFGYQVATQFGLSLKPRTPGLVPFTLGQSHLDKFAPLVGSAVDINVECNNQSFREALLFTHRGISGPAILQISSYWQPGDTITINWLPNLQLNDFLEQMKRERPKTELRTILGELLTKKWAQVFCEHWIESKPLNQLSGQELQKIADRLHAWQITPAATEGYRTAEVTLGGVDVNELSSKTMEAKKQMGLYFIGEVVDVTGWLGGFNFQWAWASGYAAGEVV